MSSEEQPAREAPLEVPVERLPEGYDPGRDPGPAPAKARGGEQLRDLGQTVGPVLAGLLVDLLDAATVNPLLGLILGWPLGYYIVRQVGCRPPTAIKLGALIAAYCATPGTFMIPMATLVVVFAKVRQFMNQA